MSLIRDIFLETSTFGQLGVGQFCRVRRHIRKTLSAIAISTFLTMSLAGCSPSPSTSNVRTTNNPGAANANIRVGMLLLKKNQTEMAKNNFLSALREAPRDPASWYSMAYFYEVTGHIKKATSMYKRAIRLSPRSGAAHNNYGTFLCRQKRYDKAIAQFNLAAQEPGYLDVGSAYENAGLCATLIPNSTLAIQLFKKALKNSPYLTTSLKQLAALYQKNGQPNLAQTYQKRYKQVLKLTQQNKQAIT